MTHPTRSPGARRGRRRAVAVAVALAATAASSAVGAGRSSAASTDTNRIGLVCTSDAAGTPTFDLETATGYISLPDGNTTYMLGYTLVGKPFQHPSPVLCVTQGDVVTVRLHNTLNRRTSIAFPGQDGVLAGGVAAGPEFSGTQMTSLTTSVATGATVEYRFVAANAGTFLYQSGTDPEVQVRVGLFGALVVRPAGQPLQAYARSDSRFTQGEEFLALLSELDPYLNQAVETNRTFDMSNYKPRYWLINGRGFPDSVADNFATWLPSQPYGALARVHPFSTTAHPYPALTRYLNVGTEEYPFHPHGNNGRLIGRDGAAMEGPGGEDLSLEKFSLNIGPGQTWDVLSRWYDAEGYSPTNPVTVTVPNVASQTFGMFYSGSPYLGEQGTLPPGATTLNQCGEFYIIAHNHALHQLTSWGVNMTGPITYLRVDPPLPNSCG